MKRTTSCLLTVGIATALASCAHNSSPTAAVEQRFKSYDSDSDGKVTPGEYSDAATRIIFASFDANEDSNVTLAEWQALEGKETDALFSKHDGNKDGKVTLDEALARTKKTKPFANDFPGIDANKDGVVVLEEAKAFAAARKA